MKIGGRVSKGAPESLNFLNFPFRRKVRNFHPPPIQGGGGWGGGWVKL